MKRKLGIAAFCLVAVLCGFAGASLYALVAPPPPSEHHPGSFYFSDVSPNLVFDNDIGFVAESGIAKGFSDGTFGPDRFVTRGQMASFLAKTLALGSQGGELLVDYDYFNGFFWGQDAFDSGFITNAEFTTFQGVYNWLSSMIVTELNPLGYPWGSLGSQASAPTAGPARLSRVPLDAEVATKMAEVKARILREHPEAAAREQLGR